MDMDTRRETSRRHCPHLWLWEDMINCAIGVRWPKGDMHVAHTHTHYGQPRHGGWKLMTTPLPVRERKLRLACPRQFIANLQAPIPIPITLGILLSSKKIFAQTSSSHRILQGLVILGGYPNTCSIVPLCNSWNCLLAIVLPDRCIRSPHFWDLLTYHPIPS
jgi:hypothetical protein